MPPLSIAQILGKPIKPTFTGFPAEISDKILENLLPSPQVDKDGRQYLSSYPASLSREAFMVLYMKFQPVLIRTNHASFLQSHLAFGVPFKLVNSPIPRAALVLGINHPIEKKKVNVRFAVTGVEYLPMLISMMNGFNCTRLFRTPRRRDLMATVNRIYLEYHVEEVLRGAPNYLNKLFDGVKGLRMYSMHPQKHQPPPGQSYSEVKIHFIALDNEDTKKSTEIKQSAKTPALTIKESEADARVAMAKGIQVLENKQYTESMMWFGISANILGRHIYFGDPADPLPRRPGDHTIMIELFVLFSKAASAMGNTNLICQMLDRARRETEGLRGEQFRRRLGPDFIDQDTEIRLVKEIVLGMIDTRLQQNLTYTVHFLKKSMRRHPDSQVLIDLKATFKQARFQFVTDMVARDSYEGYRLATKILRDLKLDYQDDREIEAWKGLCVYRYHKAIPTAVCEFMEEDVYNGYLKAQALFSAEFGNNTRNTAILQARTDCDIRLVSAVGLEAANEFKAEMNTPNTNPYIPSRASARRLGTWSPKKYFTELEQAIMDDKETAKGLGSKEEPEPPSNPRKGKAGELFKNNKDRKILKQNIVALVIVVLAIAALAFDF